jgi:sterol desaturase/sphingolipid hydroxylase (fatty acid hydroxylase superfamily)
MRSSLKPLLRQAFFVQSPRELQIAHAARQGNPGEWHLSRLRTNDASSQVINRKFFLLGPMLMSAIGYYIFALTSSIPGHLSIVLIDWFGKREAIHVTMEARVSVTILSYLAIDFGFFVVLYMQHHIPALWRFHKVHHSATVLTPFTDFRAHPVQLALMLLVTSVVVGQQDVTTPPGMARAIHDASATASVGRNLIIVPGADHDSVHDAVETRVALLRFARANRF